MLTVACILLYLAIVKIRAAAVIPIDLALLANLPITELMAEPIYEMTDKGYELNR